MRFLPCSLLLSLGFFLLLGCGDGSHLNPVTPSPSSSRVFLGEDGEDQSNVILNNESTPMLPGGNLPNPLRELAPEEEQAEEENPEEGPKSDNHPTVTKILPADSNESDDGSDTVEPDVVDDAEEEEVPGVDEILPAE